MMIDRRVLPVRNKPDLDPRISERYKFDDSDDDSAPRQTQSKKGKAKAKGKKKASVSTSTSKFDGAQFDGVNPRVMLISLKAGALGLNLTVANNVYLSVADPSWLNDVADVVKHLAWIRKLMP